MPLRSWSSEIKQSKSINYSHHDNILKKRFLRIKVDLKIKQIFIREYLY